MNKNMYMDEYEMEVQIRKNFSLIHYVINHNFHINQSFHDYEDLVSIGSYGLYKAIVNFNPNKGKFSTLAVSLIKNEIINQYFKKCKSKELSLNISIYEKSTLEDLICVSSDLNPLDKIIIKDEFLTILDMIFNALKPDESIILLYKMAQLTYREIASLLGISFQRVGKIKGTAIDRLKKAPRNYTRKFILDSMNDEYYRLRFKNPKKSNETISLCFLPTVDDIYILGQKVQEILLPVNAHQQKQKQLDFKCKQRQNNKELVSEIVKYISDTYSLEDMFTIKDIAMQFPDQNHETVSHLLQRLNEKYIRRVKRGVYQCIRTAPEDCC